MSDNMLLYLVWLNIYPHLTFLYIEQIVFYYVPKVAFLLMAVKFIAQ